jgi:SAM-dependent methyltransferase
MSARHLLDLQIAFRFYQWLVGAGRYTRLFAERYLKCTEGERVMDIGCGPATILDYLPADCDYTGIDINPDYIAGAERRYARGRFICAGIDDLSGSGFNDVYDKVFCIGVMHHLSDEQAKKMLHFGCSILKSGGKFLSLEPVWSPPQGVVERWFMNHDRGKFIRSENHYGSLANEAFGNSRIEILRGTMNIPFTIAIIQSQKLS